MNILQTKIHEVVCLPYTSMWREYSQTVDFFMRNAHFILMFNINYFCTLQLLKFPLSRLTFNSKAISGIRQIQ